MKTIASVIAGTVLTIAPSAFAQAVVVTPQASLDFQVAKPVEETKSIETATQLAVAGSLLGPAIAGAGLLASEKPNPDLIAIGLGVGIVAPFAGRW